jgi:transposase
LYLLHARSTPEGAIEHLGIDVHRDDSRVDVLDEDGKVVEEDRVGNPTPEEVAEAYAGSKAAIEATSNYYTIYDTLDEYLDVVVADPQQAKAIGTVEVKNDRVDANLLA